MTQTAYQKYIAKLAEAGKVLHKVVDEIEKGPVCTTEDDINARIHAANTLANYAAEAKRSLLYFKNRLGRPDVL